LKDPKFQTVDQEIERRTNVLIKNNLKQ